MYLGQRADLLHLNLVQTGHVSDVVDGVHGGILLGIVVNFPHIYICVAWSIHLVHNVFSLMQIVVSGNDENLSSERKAMKHQKYHQHYQVKAAKLHGRADACLDIALACIIGIGLAACLFFGLSA